MGKGKYHAQKIKGVVVAQVVERVGERAVVAIDVAKTDFVAAVLDDRANVAVTVKWTHPSEHEEFLGFVEALVDKCLSVEAVMEPTSTYGDCLRQALLERQLLVYRVNPKHTHDMKEVYDGTPSLHDAKSAAIIGKLHVDRCSELWPAKSLQERRLTAALKVLSIDAKEFNRNRSQLEALLARHWPELTGYLELGSATLLELLSAFGSPAEVVAHTEVARQLMKRVGGNFLASEKIEDVLRSAESSCGVPAIDEEQVLVREVATRARQAQKRANTSKSRVVKLTGSQKATKNMAPIVGAPTAAVVVAGIGDPVKYGSARAYLKCCGLNVREKSSGNAKGALHITKRGPSVVRYYIYFAALRLIKGNAVVKAWYAAKVKRDGEKAKLKAVIAVMRKLVLALYHVGRGATFDVTKLFDVRRLNIRVVQLKAV